MKKLFLGILRRVCQSAGLKLPNLLLLVIAGALASSCSSITVSSDYDRHAGFSSYKTYALTKEAEALPVGDINRTRILDAVANELAKKGFSKSDQPDVLIDVNITAAQKQTATATSSGPGYYGYGAGYRYGWGGGFTTTTINVENYLEGTLFVDMVDASKKQLVWQGRAVGTIDEDATPERREKNINYAISQIFTRYPPKK
ncbi:MAG TPA: DUF4136 domain-containing protein [Chryseolinea sp.]